jgi:hypothetical protein
LYLLDLLFKEKDMSDEIVGGGVGIVLARMESHPEEFHAESDKWKFIYKDYFRDAMSETEKGMIFDKIRQIRKDEFNQMVLQTLVPPEVEDITEEEADWNRSRGAFGSAPIKREGSKVRY